MTTTIINDPERRLARAKIQLLQDQPFFGTLLSQKPVLVSEDPEVATAAAINGERIEVNPDFMKKLNDRELQGLLCHEVLHIAFLHMFRFNRRDPKMWNIACDLAINPMIVEAGLTLPPTDCLIPELAGKSAEEIYNLLPTLPPSKQPKDYMDDIHEEMPKTKEEARRLKQQVKIELAAAHAKAEKAGKISENLKRMIGDLISPKVPWQDQLHDFAMERAKDDYSWSKPNRRFIAQDVFLPSLYSEALPPIAVFVDTSGSIPTDKLTEFASEINSIIDMKNPRKVYVFYIDTAIRGFEQINRGDTWDPKPCGFGGTNFATAFDDMHNYIDEPPCGAVFFTDLYTSNFGNEPEFPVIWVDFDSNENNSKPLPDFGTVISMEA